MALSAQPPQAALPVLIIGAGIGGLTLAHSLQKHKIPYHIFERDSSPTARTQGYRVSIDDGGASALKAAVMPDVFERFEKTCGESHRPVGRVNARSGKMERNGVIGLVGTGGWGMLGRLVGRYGMKRWERLGQPQPEPVVPQTVSRHYQVDRQTLRSVLLQSQSDKITYNASFAHYTIGSSSPSSPSSPSSSISTESGVTAHFADGTSITGSLLVGADGIRSQVAAQLLGQKSKALTYDMHTRIIYGKTPLTPEVDQALSPLLRKGVAFVRDEVQGIIVVLECMRFDHSQKDVPGNYIFWAINTTAESLGMSDEDLLGAGGPKAARILRDLTREWDPAVRVIFESQDKSQTAITRMTTSHPDDKATWETNRRVTVLGDAVHCMPPTGGQGANAAMHDAAALGEVPAAAMAPRKGAEDEAGVGGDGGGIVGKGRDEEGPVNGWRVETVRRYEEVMRWNVGDVVGLACIGAKGMFGATIPGSSGA